MRTLGQWMAKLRRMASEFQGQFHEAMREAEMADLKKQVDEMTSQAQSYANFDPVGDIRKEFETTQQQIESAIAGPPPEPTQRYGAAAIDRHRIRPGAERRRGRHCCAEAPTPMSPRSTSAPSEPAPAGSAAEPAGQDAGGKPA